jgi:hypothetical protein
MSITQLTLSIVLVLVAYGVVGQMDYEEALRSARQKGSEGHAPHACDPARRGATRCTQRAAQTRSVEPVQPTADGAGSPAPTRLCHVSDHE